MNTQAVQSQTGLFQRLATIGDNGEKGRLKEHGFVKKDHFLELRHERSRRKIR